MTSALTAAPVDLLGQDPQVVVVQTGLRCSPILLCGTRRCGFGGTFATLPPINPLDPQPDPDPLGA
jgi:hypothetical protein